MLYAEVVVHRSVDQSFTYHVPDELAAELEVGHLVRVSFGTAQESALVTRLTDEKPSFATKPILEIFDPQPALTKAQIALGYWLAEETITPIGQCLWTMLPPGFTPRSDHLYTLLDSTFEGRNREERRVINLLRRRGSLDSKQMTAGYGSGKWRQGVKKLLIQSIVAKQSTLLPPTAKPKFVKTVYLNVEPEKIALIATRLGRELKTASILEILWAHPQHWMTVDDILETADCNTLQPLHTLVKKGFITIEETEAGTPIAELILDERAAYEQIIELRGGHPYLNILYTLVEAGGTLSASEVYAQTNTNLTHLERLYEDGLVMLGESEIWRDTLTKKSIQPSSPPTLTSGQTQVWGRIRAYMEARHAEEDLPEAGVFLLHGVTGSGKTEVYLHAVELAIQQGEQAIVMVPEISLTTQMLQRFAARFPGKVALVHSTLSAGERYDTWRRIREGQVDVVIGARSALFAPLPKVGIIILDEEHDDSYKQSPPVMAPFYHARDAAIQYMRIQNHGTVILGSATPDVVTYFRAWQGNYTLLEMPNRVLAHRDVVEVAVQTHSSGNPFLPNEPEIPINSLPLPPVEVVDMRQELRMGNKSMFSRSLHQAIQETLAQQQQIILFLNRRGSSTYVFCRDCGYIAMCSYCDTTLTYHRSGGGVLFCHHCGRKQPNPAVCPECKSKRIRYFGSGTEQIEKAITDTFPMARILRWDQDSVSRQGAHKEIYEAFKNEEANVLVGTQMITKGLDLPKVTLVGVISADTALGLPDFRANEHTFQLLTQVAGRAGRSSLKGRVIFQTYNPENYAIQAAAKHDYHTFYKRELAYRQQMRWTPYVRLARVLFRFYDAEKLEAEARKIARALQKRIDENGFTASEIIGPVPCFFGKESNLYRWQILVRSPEPARLFQGFQMGSMAELDIDPVDIL